MKLIDILARELKVWPEGSVTAAQDSDGEVKFDDSPEFPVLAKSRRVWIRQGNTGDTIRLNEIASDYAISIVTRAQWQAAVDALAQISSPEWEFIGLPPIGLHVVVHDDGSLVYGQGESGEVLAHVEGCAVIRMSYGLGCFLPRCLRTPEQVAADARQKGIEELGNFLSVNAQVPTPYLWEAAQKIYDAGYRKQATND